MFVSGQEAPDEMRRLVSRPAILENHAEYTENALAQGNREEQRDTRKIHAMPRDDSSLEKNGKNLPLVRVIRHHLECDEDLQNGGYELTARFDYD
jgi:hypothetical protein